MMGINITEDMISAFERGITEPKLNQIASICKFFNATPNFLFGYTQFSSNELIDNSNHDLKMYLAENNISLEDVLKSIKVFENYIKELY